MAGTRSRARKRDRERELAGNEGHTTEPSGDQIVDSGVKALESESVVATILTAVKQMLRDEGARRRIYRDMTTDLGIERIDAYVIDHDAQLRVHLAKEILRHATSTVGWNMCTEFSKTTQLRAFNLIAEVLMSEREEREKPVDAKLIVNAAVAAKPIVTTDNKASVGPNSAPLPSATPVLGRHNHSKSIAKESPRQSPRLTLHKAATLCCSNPRATQMTSKIFRSSSVIAKGTGTARTSRSISSNGGALESSITVSSVQSTPETGVSGAAGLQRGRLSPKSGSQLPQKRGGAAKGTGEKNLKTPRRTVRETHPVVTLQVSSESKMQLRQHEKSERFEACLHYLVEGDKVPTPWLRKFSPMHDLNRAE